VTVSSAVLTSIGVTPANTTIAVQSSVQYSAAGTFSDGSQSDITAFVTWTSSNTAVADVSNAATSRGLAKGFAPGTATISATRGAISGTTTLTVR
jgi:hypothetical protein